MIYYFCFDNSKPTGGNKIAYRHVEALNELGFEACIVHQNENFEYTQISHKPPITNLKQLRLNVNDIFVLPEDLGPALNSIAPGIKKVIFNQNAYNSFKGYKLFDSRMPPYVSREYIACLAVSEDSRLYLETAFPGVCCHRIHISFRQELFSCKDLSAKQRQICFMTRKNQSDVIQVISQLRIRNNLSGWNFQAIENATEEEVARIMIDSTIFLAFGHPEGFGLSSLEALSAGCNVIGYSGIGGREFFGACFCSEIPFGEITNFVKTVEYSAAYHEKNRAQFEEAIKHSQKYVQMAYSPRREKEDLLAVYRSISNHNFNE